jgi:hypothetical protein
LFIEGFLQRQRLVEHEPARASEAVHLPQHPYAALYSRIRVCMQLKPINERERFAQLIQHALKTAGGRHILLADSGLELLRQASNGMPRAASGAHSAHGDESGGPEGIESLARRSATTGNRGAAVKLDIESRFPEGISGETAWGGEILLELALALDPRYAAHIARVTCVCQSRRLDEGDARKEKLTV